MSLKQAYAGAFVLLTGLEIYSIGAINLNGYIAV